jgi:NAD(P)-dependent dehydrogenase (short-subunit alcohol dehydrogenase family)
MMKKFLISGITSGLGYELALKALSEGHIVFGILRNSKKFLKTVEYQRLLEYNSEYEDSMTDIIMNDEDRHLPINKLILWDFDLAEALSPDRKRQLLQVMQIVQSLDYIYHFAGYLEGGAWEDIEYNKLEAQFRVNFLNIQGITKILIPYLNPQAKVFTAGSVAGKFSYPLMGPYCTSKAALRVMMEIWSAEAKPKGIQFVNFTFGPIQTPFWNKSRRTNDSTHSDYQIQIETLKKFSHKIEGSAYTENQVIERIWKLKDKAQLDFDIVIVKNKLINYHLPNWAPQFIKNFIYKKLLKLDTRFFNY